MGTRVAPGGADGGDNKGDDWKRPYNGYYKELDRDLRPTPNLLGSLLGNDRTYFKDVHVGGGVQWRTYFLARSALTRTPSNLELPF